MSITALLEADEVVDTYPSERRQLGTAQAGRAAALRRRQPDVGGAHRFATRADELAELTVDHGHQSAGRGSGSHGPGSTSLDVASPLPPRPPMIDGHDPTSTPSPNFR